MKSFVLSLIFIMFFIVYGAKNHEVQKAKKLNQSKSIILDRWGCELANLSLENEKVEPFKISNEKCFIGKNFTVELESIGKYRFSMEKASFVIAEKNIFSF